MTNDSRLREVALIIADDLIGICETATKVAHRTGNTFVIDRQRTASMIQGRIASLNKPNPNEHQPHAGGLLPCPFCGKAPRLHNNDGARYGCSEVFCADEKCMRSSTSAHFVNSKPQLNYGTPAPMRRRGQARAQDQHLLLLLMGRLDQ